MSKKIALTLTDWAGIDARGARIHYGHACIYRDGREYVMEGKTGKHTLDRDTTNIDRLNAHWIEFAKLNAYEGTN